MGMRSNDDRFFQTHTRVPFLDKEITGNTINIPTEVSCIVPFKQIFELAELFSVMASDPAREKALADYRQKLMEHREVDCPRLSSAFILDGMILFWYHEHVMILKSVCFV